MILYKYSGPDGLRILESQSIFLTHPSAFNDPFDTNPHFATTMYAQVAPDQPVFAFSNARITSRDYELKTSSLVVCCLSVNPTSMLMWAHYADAHAGLAIGFDADAILANSSPHRRLERVRYVPERPTAATAMDLTDEEVLWTKSAEWRHEQEWRITDSHFSADGDAVDPPACHRWPFAIRPEAVQEVVLGCRSGVDLRCSVMDLLRQPHYQHVRLFRAFMDERRYSLTLSEQERENWP